jgi:hypothetical protein
MMTDCRCMTPPLDYTDYTYELLGIDETAGRFGEVSVQTCKACGSHWLHYFVEYEAFSKSGRWYRGLVTADMLRMLTPESTVALLESLPWYLYGGSYFGTTGRKGSGSVQVDL